LERIEANFQSQLGVFAESQEMISCRIVGKVE
jgi:hypothetical protein